LGCTNFFLHPINEPCSRLSFDGDFAVFHAMVNCRAGDVAPPLGRIDHGKVRRLAQPGRFGKNLSIAPDAVILAELIL
jgi:hypothetical protein